MLDKDFWHGKKVLLTGHTGFKGSWLSLLLYKLGAKICGYSLTPPTQPNLFELAGIEKVLDSVIGDVRNGELLKQTICSFQPEIVIHMAAQPLVRESYNNPLETYEVNIMGTVKLLEAVRSISSVRAVVNVTTDKCYENQEWHWGYRENEPLGGYDPYSSSKACSELVAAAYRNSFFPPHEYKNHLVAIASARAGNVIGGGDWAKDRLIPDCLKSLISNKKIIIRNPAAIRPWQHVLEPLGGYLLLAEKLYREGIKYGEAWNFGPEDKDAQPVEWIVQRMCSLWQENAQYEVDQRVQPHEASFLKLDCSKAKNRLGWQPRWGLETALIKIIEWTRAYERKQDLQAKTLQQIAEYFTEV